MVILILGATGMLGYSLFTNLKDNKTLSVYGTVRSIKGKEKYFSEHKDNIIDSIDVLDFNSLKQVLELINPDVVINCIGLIKQHSAASKYTNAVEINSLLPHKLAEICDAYNARLIHFSTDCVFKGNKGMYQDDYESDASDLYGKSKSLGEVSYGKHLTLRTSIIGHELDSNVSLVDWFLNQHNEVKGFRKAIFSGLPTCYIAKLLSEVILKNDNLHGVYNLSVEPIDKYTLLKIIAEKYNKVIDVNVDDEFVIDRSLNSDKLREMIKFTPPKWPDLIEFMHQDYKKRY